jgi:hypothetical protein
MSPGTGSTSGHGKAAVLERAHINDLPARQDDRAVLFRQIEVVAIQGVLGVVSAADHASPAGNAARPAWSGASEEGIGDLDSGLAEEHAYWGRTKRVFYAEVRCDLPDHAVGWRVERSRAGTQHALGKREERRQLRLPIGDRGPLGVGVEGIVRLVQGVGVAE